MAAGGIVGSALFAQPLIDAHDTGLDVYAIHPKFQFGPLAIVAAEVRPPSTRRRAADLDQRVRSDDEPNAGEPSKQAGQTT